MSVETDPVPPVPEHTPPLKEDEHNPQIGKYFNHVWTRWFVSLREKINVLNESLIVLAGVVGTGILVKNGASWLLRSIAGTANRTLITNGDGAAGNPTVNVVTNNLVAGTGISFTGDPLNRIIDNGAGALTINSTAAGGGYSQGTSFPLTPTTDDKFYRTDLNLLCYFDGTRWLTVQQFDVASSMFDALAGSTASGGARGRWAARNDYDLWLVRWVVTTYVATTNTAVNYWSLSLNSGGAAIASFTTAADSPNAYINHDINLGVALSPTAVDITCVATRVGTGGGLYPAMSLIYRLIVT